MDLTIHIVLAMAGACVFTPGPAVPALRVHHLPLQMLLGPPPSLIGLDFADYRVSCPSGSQAVLHHVPVSPAGLQQWLAPSIGAMDGWVLHLPRITLRSGDLALLDRLVSYCSAALGAGGLFNTMLPVDRLNRLASLLLVRHSRETIMPETSHSLSNHHHDAGGDS